MTECNEGDAGAGIRREAQFPVTRWSLVFNARSDQSAVADRALSSLCAHYWYPLYSYARRLGKTREEAEDLTQEFFARVLAKNYLDPANSAKGRLRTFLITAFKRFLANEWKKAHAEKRGGGVRPLSIDADWGEERYHLEPADTANPDHLYERQWALNLLDRVMSDLRGIYAESGKDAVFEVLKPCIMADGKGQRYRDIGEQLGLQEGAVKVAVHRLRKHYRDALRSRIAETVESEEEIEEEIRQLFAVFSE